MSERGYFPLRYAIPGFAFILIVIGLNYVPLLSLLNSPNFGSVFGAFLAFLTLFSGSAIGFLVSQVHWWRFKYTSLIGTKEMAPLAKAIYIKYLKKPEEKAVSDAMIQTRLDAVGNIFEYIIRHEKDEKFFQLAERRWDMYHLFSSTTYSLVIGFIIGVFFRLYYEWFFFEPFHEISINDMLAIPLLENPEFVTQLFTIGIVVFFSYILWNLRPVILKGYVPVLKASLAQSYVTRQDVEVLFPEFFNTETK